MILCCGEALVDMLPRKSDQGEEAFAPTPGGAVFNTAIALGRLDAQVGFVCGLSRDMFGERLMAALEGANVDHSLCPLSDRPTTLAFVTLTDGQARYAFFDENSAMRAMQVADLPPLPDQAQALFLGGISLISEPCGTAFEALSERAGDRVVMLDPNIRPGFIRDEAAYRARLRRMIARADIVKLSDEDLAWLHPGAGADAVLAEGPAIVFITRGGEGADAHTAQGSLHMPATPITVADTVGAGDTFNAGILAHLQAVGALRRTALRDLPEQVLRDALALATRAAAVTASRPGANPPRRADLA